MRVQYRAKTDCIVQGRLRTAGEEFSLTEIPGGHKHLEVVGEAAAVEPEALDAPLKTPEQIAAAPAAQVFKIQSAKAALYHDDQRIFQRAAEAPKAPKAPKAPRKKGKKSDTSFLE